MTEPKDAVPLEIAHVLFMDIVGYTKLPLDHQRNTIKHLQDVVAISPAFIQAKTQSQLISLHAGDGMALVFFNDTEAAARCAVEVSQALRASLDQIPLRMGLHTGPVYRTADINAHHAVAGGGINVAQRVMDCGDAGHILVSNALAEVLDQLSRWTSCLHDLGQVEVKHGVRLHLYNLYTNEVGNQEFPKKINPQIATPHSVPSSSIRRKPIGQKFSVETLRAGASRSQPVQASTTNRWRNLSLVATAVALTALALGVRQFLAHPEQPGYRQVTFRKGFIPAARFAPDGQSVIYAAAWDHPPIKLYSSRVDGMETRALDLPPGELFAVSPSGQMAMDVGGNTWMGIGGGRLASAPMSGGAPRELLDNIGAADWSPDGAQLAVARFENGKCRLEYPVGTILYETLGSISSVRFSPQGESLAFMDHPLLADDRGTVVLVDLKGNKRSLTSEWAGEQGLAWSPDGKEVWFTATNGSDVRALYAVSRSGKQRLVLRIPGSVELNDIAADGRVLLTRKELYYEVAVGQTGVGNRQLSWLDIMTAISVSHDGKWAVISDEGSRNEYDVYFTPLDGSPPVLLGRGGGGSISPDNKWVTSIVPSDTTKVLLLPTGVGETKIITAPNFHYSHAFWSSDGRVLVVIASESGRPVRVWTQTLDGAPPRPAMAEGIDGLFVTVNHVDYISVHDNKNGGVLLYPINGGEPQSPRGVTASDEVIGGAPESENLYVSPDVSAVPLQILKVNVKTGLRQQLANISPTDPAGVVRILFPLFTADEKRYLSTQIRALSVLYVASGLK